MVKSCFLSNHVDSLGQATDCIFQKEDIALVVWNAHGVTWVGLSDRMMLLLTVP